MAFVGLEFAAFWAVLIALLNYIPYIGSFLGVLFPVTWRSCSSRTRASTGGVVAADGPPVCHRQLPRPLRHGQFAQSQSVCHPRSAWRSGPRCGASPARSWRSRSPPSWPSCFPSSRARGRSRSCCRETAAFESPRGLPRRPVMNLRDISDLLRSAAVNWVQDYAQSMGAALAFYTMFSIAPLLLIVISVAGFASARTRPVARSTSSSRTCWAARRGGRRGASSRARASRAKAWWPRSSASLLLFIGATSVFAELQDALRPHLARPAKGRDRGPVEHRARPPACLSE